MTPQAWLMRGLRAALLTETRMLTMAQKAQTQKWLRQHSGPERQVPKARWRLAGRHVRRQGRLS